LLPSKCNILLEYTQEIDIHDTGVHVMAKTAQTTTLHHALGRKYFRSAEFILLLFDHVTIEKLRCLSDYFPRTRQLPAPPTEFPIPIHQSTLSTPNGTTSLSELPNLRKCIAFRKVPRLGPFVLLVTAKCNGDENGSLADYLWLTKRSTVKIKLVSLQIYSP
jgi:hypothetical protein